MASRAEKHRGDPWTPDRADIVLYSIIPVCQSARHDNDPPN